MAIKMSLLRVLLVLWSLLFATVSSQQTSRKEYGDGSYCLRCVTPAITDDASALSALLCGLDATLVNGCFKPILLDQCGDPTITDVRFNLAKGRVCASAGKCLTGCNLFTSTSYVMDWCCFRSGSPFIDTYISEVNSEPSSPDPPTVTPPPVKTTLKGINCDVVDTIIESYEIARTRAPNTVGYYGQLVNIVCLRSACPNTVCNRVESKRNKNTECNLPEEMPFEDYVFGRIANEASNPQDIIEKAGKANSMGSRMDEIFSWWEVDVGPDLGIDTHGPEEGFGDAKSWGTLFAGYGHFTENLGPYFSSYIRDLVENTPSDEDLATAISALAHEHEIFFRCAVTPGFEIEGVEGEIPPNAAKLAGSWLIPVAAREFRNYYLWKWLHANGRVREPKDMKKFGVEVSGAEGVMWNPAQFVPKYVKDAMGWRMKRDVVAASSSSMVLATYASPDSKIAVLEFSNATGTDEDVHLGTFSLSIPNREIDLQPQIAYLSTVNLTEISTATFPLVRGAAQIQIVGEVACIYPSSTSISLLNITHIIPRNISLDPVTVEKYLADLEVTVGGKPLVPVQEDKDILYRHAQISFTASMLATESTSAGELTIYDLLSGKALEKVIQTTLPTGGVEYKANVEAGKGSWGLGWSGGGCFALGSLVKNTNGTFPTPTTSNFESSGTSSATDTTIKVSSTTGFHLQTSSILPVIGEIINSVIGGPVDPPVTSISLITTNLTPSLIGSASTSPFSVTAASTRSGLGNLTATSSSPSGARTPTSTTVKFPIATFSNLAASTRRKIMSTVVTAQLICVFLILWGLQIMLL